VQDADRSGAHGIGDDRRQLGAHAVELAEQRQRAPEYTAPARDACGRNEHEPANPIGMPRRAFGGNEPAERMPDEVHGSEACRVQEPIEPLRELPGPHAAEPGKLDEMESVAACEQVDELRPPAPRAGESVHDSDVDAASRDPVREPPSVDLDLPQLHATQSRTPPPRAQGAMFGLSRNTFSGSQVLELPEPFVLLLATVRPAPYS
jgi:hypothetical protein